MKSAPISLADVFMAQRRIRPYLQATPFRRYPELEAEIGTGIQVWVKHENHQPTNSFKVRNALSALTARFARGERGGVIAATRGNHGLGVSYAGAQLGIPVTICVPLGNSPEKNAGMRALGAQLIEEGKDYDESVVIASRLMAERKLGLVHSTNNRDVLAGAATMTLEMIAEQPELDAIVVAVGGGSQAVGALVVASSVKPGLEVFAVQAEGASTIHDSWQKKSPVSSGRAETFADGLATRSTYEMTFPALLEGLAGFVTVSEAELMHAVRSLLRHTHNLAEGAGAAGYAGLMKLRQRLAGKKVGVIISGGNVDTPTLRRILETDPPPQPV